MKKVITISTSLLFILMGFSPSYGLEENYNLALEARSNTYASNQTARSLLEDINTSSYLELRGEFLSEGSNRSGNLIPDDYIYTAREYMQTTNNRAQIDNPTQSDNLSSLSPDSRPDLSDLKEPRPPRQELLDQDLKEKNEAFRKSMKEAQASFYDGSGGSALRDGIQNSEVERALKENGLSNLFSDMGYAADEYGTEADKKTLIKGIKKDAESIKKAIASTSDPNAQRILRNLLSAGQATSRKQSELRQKFDREVEVTKKWFQGAKDEYPARKKAYDQEVARRTEEARASQTRSGATSSNPIQDELNKDFFRKKKLAPIENLSQLTDSERMYLMNHADDPLGLKSRGDDKKAIELINAKRKKQRDFILKVSDISNEITNANLEGRKPQFSVKGNGSENLDKLASNTDTQSLKKSYTTQVNLRLNPNTPGVNGFGVVDGQTRLGLLDAVTGGSIDPNHKIDISKLNIKESLDRIPGNNIQARKAFASYILENGSELQIRSLKIQDPSTVHLINADQKFQARCRKPATTVRSNGW